MSIFPCRDRRLGPRDGGEATRACLGVGDVDRLWGELDQKMLTVDGQAAFLIAVILLFLFVGLFLEGIAAMIGDMHAIIANDWLGQEVAVASKHVAYEGKPVEFEVNPSLAHDAAIFTVKDSQDNIVWQEALDANAERYQWDGALADHRAKAANGVYQFQLDLYKDGQPIATTDAEIISKVTTLSSENGKLVLGTDNYLTADLSATRKLSAD